MRRRSMVRAESATRECRETLSWSFVAETRRHQKFPTSESRTFIMESSTDLLVHLTTSFAWVLYRMSIQVHIRLVLGSELSFPSSHLIHYAFQKLEASQLACNKTKCESLSVYKITHQKCDSIIHAPLLVYGFRFRSWACSASSELKQKCESLI